MVSRHANAPKRPNRSSTLRLSENHHNFEFTLGAGELIKGKSAIADIIRGRQQHQATRIIADGYLKGRIGQEPAEFSPEVSSPSSDDQPIETLFTHGND